mmetsp:Transcript_20051/g.63436  ORF Transcript_20051/g.63436 Transcript_20051/m.63436 type:complete len:270 (+) Transcript_20051:415-1224(+)
MSTLAAPAKRRLLSASTNSGGVLRMTCSWMLWTRLPSKQPSARVQNGSNSSMIVPSEAAGLWHSCGRSSSQKRRLNCMRRPGQVALEPFLAWFGTARVKDSTAARTLADSHLASLKTLNTSATLIRTKSKYLFILCLSSLSQAVCIVSQKVSIHIACCAGDTSLINNAMLTASSCCTGRLSAIHMAKKRPFHSFMNSSLLTSVCCCIHFFRALNPRSRMCLSVCASRFPKFKCMPLSGFFAASLQVSSIWCQVPTVMQPDETRQAGTDT